MLAAALAEIPALPLHTAGKYVAGAYVVLFALVLIYVAIMALRLSRIERDLGELLSMSERPAGVGGQDQSAEHDPRRESAPA
ncbi:MAG: hypothetical protein ABSB69_01150 [Solirubrobacteraceae bacterium]|jgi:hypothetical protein